MHMNYVSTSNVLIFLLMVNVTNFGGQHRSDFALQVYFDEKHGAPRT